MKKSLIWHDGEETKEGYYECPYCGNIYYSEDKALECLEGCSQEE